MDFRIWSWISRGKSVLEKRGHPVTYRTNWCHMKPVTRSSVQAKKRRLLSKVEYLKILNSKYSIVSIWPGPSIDISAWRGPFTYLISGPSLAHGPPSLCSACVCCECYVWQMMCDCLLLFLITSYREVVVFFLAGVSVCAINYSVGSGWIFM